jgi:phenylalanine-4-hydroxylase
MIQEYNKYSADDFQTWSLLFEPQIKLLQGKACDEFLNGVATLKFSDKKIPDFKETNAILQNLTGWQIHVVPGLIPAQDFFTLLHEKKFCSSTWLRSREQLEYLEEPDMFHDVFGHVPFLANQEMSEFLLQLSGVALKYISNEKVIELISRVYWFTVEFGLLKNTSGEIRILGAGILSSPGETVHCLSATEKHQPFDMTTIIDTEYRIDVYQNVYFVLDSLDQLKNSIKDLERILADRFGTS